MARRSGTLLVALSVASSGCSLLVTPGENAATRDGGVARDAGPTACVDTEVRITGNLDDGETKNGALWVDGEVQFGPGIFIGTWDQTFTWGYFRFELPDEIHPDHLEGYISLSLWGENVSGWDSQRDRLFIRLENVDDAMVVQTGDRTPAWGGAAPTTEATTRWPALGNLDWEFGSYNESPDLTPMFRELVANQGPLRPGQHVLLWVRGEDLSVNAEILTHDYSLGAAANVAFLRLRCP